MMRELLMHISQEPGRVLEIVDASGNRIIPKREPAEKLIEKIEQLAKGYGMIEVRSFRVAGVHHVDKKVFIIRDKDVGSESSHQNMKAVGSEGSRHNTVPTAKHTEHTMQDAENRVNMLLLQNENKWLKNSHEKLERENSELRVTNEKLRVENNDLTIKNLTGEKEKELALKHQEVSQKKGLGSIGSPDEINSFLTGIADMIKSFKGDGGGASASNAPALTGMSQVKQEVMQFLGEKLNSVEDDQAQKLAYIIKTVLERNKVDYLFTTWTENNQSN